MSRFDGPYTLITNAGGFVRVLGTGAVSIEPLAGQRVGINSAVPGALLEIDTSAATTGLIVKGAAGQVNPLQQWQNSAGVLLAQVYNTGGLDIIGTGANGDAALNLYAQNGARISNLIIGENGHRIRNVGELGLGNIAGQGVYLVTGAATTDNPNMFFRSSPNGAERLFEFQKAAVAVVTIDNSGNLVVGTGEAGATPVGLALRAPNAAGANIAGANLTVAGGQSTGTGAGGSLIFQTSPAGAAGSGVNALVSRWLINSAGHLLANTDNAVDIGAAGANRPANLYVASTGTFGGLVNITAGGLQTKGNPAGPAADVTNTNTRLIVAAGSNAGANDTLSLVSFFRTNVLAGELGWDGTVGVIAGYTKTVNDLVIRVGVNPEVLIDTSGNQYLNGFLRAAGALSAGGDTAGLATYVALTNVVNNAANSTGVGTILFKGATNRNSSGFLKILDGVTARYIPYFDAITG